MKEQLGALMARASGKRKMEAFTKNIWKVVPFKADSSQNAASGDCCLRYLEGKVRKTPPRSLTIILLFSHINH